MNLGKPPIQIAAAKKEGKKTITYLGIDEKLPWIVGARNPSIA